MYTLRDIIDYRLYTNVFSLYLWPIKLQDLFINKWLQVTKNIQYCNKNNFIYKKSYTYHIQ